MRILVIGAGVIGSVYGGRLALAGHDVTVMARGSRLQAIASGGLKLHDVVSGRGEEAKVAAVSVPSPDAVYDLVLVTVRDAQLPQILPVLDVLAGAPRRLFLVNCPMRVADLVGRYGAERTLFGFAGAGGVHDGEVIRYCAVRQQPTTFGPVAGQDGSAAQQMAALFDAAGFATTVVADMDAWLKTHAFLIAAICGALYASGGRSAQLAAEPAKLEWLIGGLREGLRCVTALGLTPSPLRLRLMTMLPDFILRRLLARLFASDMAAFAIDGHANAAPEDMADLARDCRRMIAASGVAAPMMLALCERVDRAAVGAAA